MKKLFLLSYTVLLSVFSAQGESVLLSCERVPFDDKILETKVWDVNVQSVIDETVMPVLKFLNAVLCRNMPPTCVSYIYISAIL